MILHTHRSGRSGWLRAAVLGANDGVLSISSLLLGVAAAHVDLHAVLAAGLAGLAAGACAMGAGEYVSVSSQADTERADLDLERRSLAQNPAAEHAELRDIYRRRGLDRKLAGQVAHQLMLHDALDAHARDEIGITATLRARPLQAAGASSLSFLVGGVVPLAAASITPASALIPVVAGVSFVFLAALGAGAARAGGASPWRGAARVLIWGAVAMSASSMVGALFGTRL